jgi:putative proteasome-type protease
MTYCVGMLVDEGLVLASDSRTNAGVDHIATFSKTTVWEKPGERVLVLLSSGNLAVTQAVINLIKDGFETEEGEDHTTMDSVPTMFGAARLVGRAVREVFRADGEALKEFGSEFNPAFILGGQMIGRSMRLFQIYSAGNFIEATPENVFFQIGEIKYGKPILDRALRADSTLSDATKLALVSMDSTMRSNISVGLPIDLTIIEKDRQAIKLSRRIDEDDRYFREISNRWSKALQKAFQQLPAPNW